MFITLAITVFYDLVYLLFRRSYLPDYKKCSGLTSKAPRLLFENLVNNSWKTVRLKGTVLEIIRNTETEYNYPHHQSIW